ncbi:(2Fe-2S) ferredoxin domain-containing protein [Pseudalkalibacillus sp. A8]|uniref:(2Fe-2S) ferredoxin domain-containing protein n=1 Tax=Pseudalkalibacillus sp. A8 TaxID=3382641 RepID=UPI0038B47FA6
MNGAEKHILLCNGKSCTKNGAEDVTNAIREEIKALGLTKTIHTTKTLCNGQCKRGPTVITYPDGVWYQYMTSESGKELVQRLLKGEHLESHISLSHNGRNFEIFKNLKE